MIIATKIQKPKCFMTTFSPEITTILIKLSRYDNYLTDVYHMEYKIRRFSAENNARNYLR